MLLRRSVPESSIPTGGCEEPPFVPGEPLNVCVADALLGDSDGGRRSRRRKRLEKRLMSSGGERKETRKQTKRRESRLR